jgi:hypothetical protein
VGFGIYCLSANKACFGSCPTFYTDDTRNQNLHYSDAEGFSNAIAPFLETHDIDEITYKSESSSLNLTMKNEALETHCINELKIFAVPHDGQQIFHSTTDEFYAASEVHTLAKASCGNEDVTALMKHADKAERFSLSDEEDLVSREEIVLDFSNTTPLKEAGLVIHFRQSLMTTFLIYNALSYMGDEATDLLAGMQRKGDGRTRFSKLSDALGRIEVERWDAEQHKWKRCGSLYETGPIAINRQMLKLGGTGTHTKLRLIMNRGLWRIDYVALANLTGKAEPLIVSPASVSHQGTDEPTSVEKLKDTAKYLVSLPGSEYTMRFDLPGPVSAYSLFLYSKGYYLEWMREGWYAGKDHSKLRQLALQPRRYLKQQAKAYKFYETQMEHDFWNSRIAPSLSTQYAH